MAQLLLGVDVGTSGITCAIFDINSCRFLASVNQEQQVISPQPGWAQQDPANWWASVRRNIHKVLKKAAVSPADIAAIGVSGQMQAAIPLDKNNNLLSHAVQLWCDKRCADICARWAQKLDGMSLRKQFGNEIATALTAFKIKWLEENRPDEHKQTHTYLLPKDYINFQLTGILSTDYSDASGTFLMDMATKQWSEEICDTLGIDMAQLAPIKASAEVLGNITKTAALETGLSEKTVVVAGGADLPLGLLAAGVTTPGTVGEVCGSSSILAAPASKPIDAKGIRNYRHVVDGWFACSEIDTAGASLQWFRDTLGSKADFKEMQLDAAKTSPGSDGLIFLPYLLGERTMGATDGRGAFLGITLSHTKAHFIRAIMEGICLALQPSLDIFAKEGINIKKICLSGGGSRSRLWGQIRADIYGKPVWPLCQSEGSILGAVLLAGCGAGFWTDAAAQAEKIIKFEKTIEPDKDSCKIYSRSIERFQKAYHKSRMIPQ